MMFFFCNFPRFSKNNVLPAWELIFCVFCMFCCCVSFFFVLLRTPQKITVLPAFELRWHSPGGGASFGHRGIQHLAFVLSLGPRFRSLSLRLSCQAKTISNVAKDQSQNAVCFVGLAVWTPCVLWGWLYGPRVSCGAGCMDPVCLVGLAVWTPCVLWGWLYGPRVSCGAGCVAPPLPQTLSPFFTMILPNE